MHKALTLRERSNQRHSMPICSAANNASLYHSHA